MFTGKLKSRLLLGFSLLFAMMFVAVACASDDGLTKEDLADALAAQQPAAAPAGPSAAEISALVSAAVAA
ncbi:MAG: hypothetical protein IIC28_01345, partial [Chloroflexi bacterium]|nr:hypothetical protein [Chloroflexota bacterium]